jgi:hypothetical protein
MNDREEMRRKRSLKEDEECRWKGLLSIDLLDWSVVRDWNFF